MSTLLLPYATFRGTCLYLAWHLRLFWYLSQSWYRCHQISKYRQGRQGRPGASSGQHGKYINRQPLKQHSSYQPKIFTCLYYCQPADPVSGARSGIEGNALDAVKIEKPEKAKGEVTSCGMIIEIWPHPVTWAFQKNLHGEIIFIISEWWSCERLLVVHCVFSGWLIPCPRVVGLDSTQELFHSTLSPY